jgi:hypothetical protein
MALPKASLQAIQRAGSKTCEVEKAWFNKEAALCGCIYLSVLATTTDFFAFHPSSVLTTSRLA